MRIALHTIFAPHISTVRRAGAVLICGAILCGALLTPLTTFALAPDAGGIQPTQTTGTGGAPASASRGKAGVGADTTAPVAGESPATLARGKASMYTQELTTGTAEAADPNGLPTCGVFPGQSGTFAGCVTKAVYYIIFTPAAWILSIAGEIFDTFLAAAISNNLLNTDFVGTGWGLTRDLANLSFILILLYISFSTILKADTAGARTLTINVIIIALLVNFSLFFTRVVIDATNILALSFYNGISTAPTSDSGSLLSSVTESKNISGGLIAAFEPQTLMSKQSFTAWGESNTGIWGMVFVYIAAAVISIAAAWTLFQAGFLMVGRLIGLWAAMVIAPLAFVAWILPKTSGYARKWWSFLLNQAFIAPLFLFFLYMIAELLARGDFMQSSFTPIEQYSDAGIVEIILSIILKSAIILGALQFALKQTQKLSLDISNDMMKKAAGAAKLVGGKVLGGAVTVTGARQIAPALRGGIAKQAQTFLKNEGRVASTLKRIPGVAEFADTRVKRAQADVEAEQKKLKGLSTEALRASATRVGRSAIAQEAAVKELASRGELKPTGTMTAERIQQAAVSLKAKGEKIKEIEERGPQYAISDAERQSLVEALPADLSTQERARRIEAIAPSFTQVIPKLKTDDINKLAYSNFSGGAALGSMVEGFSGKHISALIDRDPEYEKKNGVAVYDAQGNKQVEYERGADGTILKDADGNKIAKSLAYSFFKQIKTDMGFDPAAPKTVADAVAYFESKGNGSAAKWAQSMEGSSYLTKVHGFKASPKKKKGGGATP